MIISAFEVLSSEQTLDIYERMCAVLITAKVACQCLTSLVHVIVVHSTGPGNNTCTWLRECCRQVESNSRNQLHQTTYKYYFRAQYIPELFVKYHKISRKVMRAFLDFRTSLLEFDVCVRLPRRGEIGDVA